MRLAWRSHVCMHLCGRFTRCRAMLYGIFYQTIKQQHLVCAIGVCVLEECKFVALDWIFIKVFRSCRFFSLSIERIQIVFDLQEYKSRSLNVTMGKCLCTHERLLFHSTSKFSNTVKSFYRSTYYVCNNILKGKELLLNNFINFHQMKTS